MTAQRTRSAEIIQFPARGRFAPDHQESKAAPPGLGSACAVRAAIGGGAWYHDEAIRDDAANRKN